MVEHVDTRAEAASSHFPQDQQSGRHGPRHRIIAAPTRAVRPCMPRRLDAGRVGDDAVVGVDGEHAVLLRVLHLAEDGLRRGGEQRRLHPVGREVVVPEDVVHCSGAVGPMGHLRLVGLRSSPWPTKATTYLALRTGAWAGGVGGGAIRTVGGRCIRMGAQVAASTKLRMYISAPARQAGVMQA